MVKAIYNRKGWILCSCKQCGRLNYVEPHGTTAKCKCSTDWTEHANLPVASRETSGLTYYGPSRLKVTD